MRDLWNVTKPPKREPGGQIQEPVKLQSIGVKRLVERALWDQGIRTELGSGRRRHEFQTDHGFRVFSCLIHIFEHPIYKSSLLFC